MRGQCKKVKGENLGDAVEIKKKKKTKKVKLASRRFLEVYRNTWCRTTLTESNTVSPHS